MRWKYVSMKRLVGHKAQLVLDIQRSLKIMSQPQR